MEIISVNLSAMRSLGLLKRDCKSFQFISLGTKNTMKVTLGCSMVAVHLKIKMQRKFVFIF